MMPFELEKIGRLLYGDHWQSALARVLAVSDRTVRRWLTGASAIPESVGHGLREALEKRLDEVGGMFRFTVNPRDRTVFHAPSGANFSYSEAGDIALLNRGFAGQDQMSLICEGAREAVRRERERDPRVEFIWVERSGRSDTTPLHGFMRGSVKIPPDVDLTDPVIDEAFDAADGALHR
jgi:hypothetical protein